MGKHSEYLNLKKDSVSGSGSLTPELFNFYMEIFLAQEDFISKTGELSEYAKNCKNNSFPVFSPENLVLDDQIKSRLVTLAGKLAEIISVVNKGMNFSLFTGKFVNDAELLLAGLLKKDYSLLEKKGLESRLALDEFIFLVHNVFKPLMVSLREKYAIKPDKGDWLESNCPFCGYLPDMSKIVESKENRRHLHCSLCENEWEFPRLLCPVCGCDDQSRIGFFEFEDNNLYRVYYCDECMHYIKSIRIPELKEESGFDPAVEDIISGFLDASMIEKGYKRI